MEREGEEDWRINEAVEAKYQLPRNKRIKEEYEYREVAQMNISIIYRGYLEFKLSCYWLNTELAGQAISQNCSTVFIRPGQAGDSFFPENQQSLNSKEALFLLHFSFLAPPLLLLLSSFFSHYFSFGYKKVYLLLLSSSLASALISANYSCPKICWGILLPAECSILENPFHF